MQWNAQRGLWETNDQVLCGHRAPFPDTWPSHGYMIDGTVTITDPTPSTDPIAVLPTHRVSATRSSRKAMVMNKQWSAPSLEQALEIAAGVLPREFRSWDEVPGQMRPDACDVLPTPTARDTGRSIDDYRAMKANMPGGPRTAITSLAVQVQIIATEQGFG